MEGILRTIELEFTILEFHRRYVVSSVHEEAILNKKQIWDLVEVCADFYKKKNFVYISKRVHNYNVDPTAYLNLENFKNLAGIAIVSKKSSALNMAKFEKTFSKVPFEIFTDLSDAKEWVDKIL